MLWRDPDLSRGTDGLQTPRWSKGDSNSPSHPERRRSKGRHIGPAYRFQFRSRALLRTPSFCGDLRYGTGCGEPSSSGRSNALTPIALSSLPACGDFDIEKMRPEWHDEVYQSSIRDKIWRYRAREGRHGGGVALGLEIPAASAPDSPATGFSRRFGEKRACTRA